MIERTREGLRRIERIVKDLRLFARVDEGEWNEVDLNPGIESSVNMVQGYARKKGVRLVSELEPLPPLRCRGARIHQVVVNLLMNAIDACGADGTVTIRTRAEPDGEGVRIEVADTGCGIEPAIRERIFDPFFTTKPIGEGTGLGLSISYGIVQEHHGTIDVQSTPGEGSCFTIRLPRGGAQSRQPRPDDRGRSGRDIMKLGLINSAWVQAGRGTAFGIRKTKEIGFDSIDIFADPLDIDVKEKRLIKDECDKAGLPIVSVACVAVGLIDFNPSVQRFHLERVKAYLDMAYLFEARKTCSLSWANTSGRRK